MTINAKPVKNPLRASVKAAACLCAAGFVTIPLPAHHVRAQDVLISNPVGEIIFEPGEPPAFEVPELDPAYRERLTSAERRKAENEAALRRLNDAMVVSSEKQTELRDSVAALDKDRDVLVEQLITTARLIQNLEDALSDTQRKLLNLADEEKRIQGSLASRRAILSEVLAALQRMGQNPPPAIAVSAGDVLQSVRSAILLGSVLPELKLEAEALVKDLNALNDVMVAVQVEQKEQIDQERELSEEQLRLDLLIKENQKLRVTSDKRLDEERQKVTALARDATNLRDLIEGISAEIAKAAAEQSSAEALARHEAEERRLALEAERQREVAVLSGLRPLPGAGSAPPASPADPPLAYQSAENEGVAGEGDVRRVVEYSNVLEGEDPTIPGVEFAQSKGLLRFPAHGIELTTFGGSDGLGGISEGITLATRARTPVITPTEGRIVFAGPFPGFQQLLIIDVGGGYHIVLAGMKDINVKIGDRVKAGEPVGVMGGKRSARLAGLSADIATTLDSDFSAGQTQPVLYVEFRKDGKSINSTPWWAKS